MESTFKELPQTIMGEKAEKMLINEFVKSKGYIPYITLNDEAHPIDCICMSGASMFLLDVKAKPRMRYYEMTGFDYADYKKYLTYEQPVYILFADWYKKEVYGAWLSKLEAGDKKVFGNIICFPLSQMTFYRNLTDEEAEELAKTSTSKYF